MSLTALLASKRVELWRLDSISYPSKNRTPPEAYRLIRREGNLKKGHEAQRRFAERGEGQFLAGRCYRMKDVSVRAWERVRSAG